MEVGIEAGSDAALAATLDPDPFERLTNRIVKGEDLTGSQDSCTAPGVLDPLGPSPIRTVNPWASASMPNTLSPRKPHEAGRVTVATRAPVPVKSKVAAADDGWGAGSGSANAGQDTATGAGCHWGGDARPKDVSMSGMLGSTARGYSCRSSA